MSSLISLNIELNAIRSFLKNVANIVDSEYSRIKTLSDAGHFSHYDDRANAYFIPEMWERIAIRATLGELNALVEWELYNLAIMPFFEKENAKSEQFEMVYDLPISKVIKLIENYYNIRLNDLEDYKNIKLIRLKVNSFKHREGFKDPRKDNCTSFGDKYEVSRAEAFQAIDAVGHFIKALRNKTQQTVKLRSDVNSGHQFLHAAILV